jgi:hypothetical protein
MIRSVLFLKKLITEQVSIDQKEVCLGESSHKKHLVSEEKCMVSDQNDREMGSLSFGVHESEQDVVQECLVATVQFTSSFPVHPL